MSASDDSQTPEEGVEGNEHPDEDPGEELEAAIEQADHPFASESFRDKSVHEEAYSGQEDNRVLSLDGRRRRQR